MTTLKIINTSKSCDPVDVILADTFFLKLKGLMFKKSILPQTGLLLQDSRESILNSSIHMLFMNFDICAIWIDEKKQVVDIKIARKWRPAYFSQTAAKYVLELHNSRFADYSIGDQLRFEYAT